MSIASQRAETLERKAVSLEREAAAAERKAEARFQGTLSTVALVLGLLIGFGVGFAAGMWKAFDILGKVIQ